MFDKITSVDGDTTLVKEFMDEDWLHCLYLGSIKTRFEKGELRYIREILRGKERKEGRQSIIFTPLDPFNSDADEAESGTDTTKPRKVIDQIHWRPEQDAVYWSHLSTVQDAGLENRSQDSSHLENDQK